MHRLQQEAKRQQKVPLHAVSRKAGVPELLLGWYMLWGGPHQTKLALGIQGEDGHRHPESTRSCFWAPAKDIRTL